MCVCVCVCVSMCMNKYKFIDIYTCIYRGYENGCDCLTNLTYPLTPYLTYLTHPLTPNTNTLP